jgi:hypothetical protein
MRQYVILMLLMVGASASAIDAERWNRVGGGSWDPTPAALTELEAALKPALVLAARNRGRLPAWREYTFQYQGRKTLLGRQFIYVNAFCSHESRDLAQDWVTVRDGGSCYFSAKYDPETKRIYDLDVNGIA